MTPKLKQEVMDEVRSEHDEWESISVYSEGFIKGAEFMYDYLLKHGPELDADVLKENFDKVFEKDFHNMKFFYFKDGAEFQHQQDAAFISTRDEKIKGLEQENKDLKYLLDSINKHVIPGELDSSEAATEIIKKQREEIKELRGLFSVQIDMHDKIVKLEKKLEIAVKALKFYTNLGPIWFENCDCVSDGIDKIQDDEGSIAIDAIKEIVGE